VLDGIRGLAILMVMALHFLGEAAFAAAPDRRFVQIAMYGGYGVDLFFVLSGFLITGILCDTRGSARYFRDFYARRALRIFPLYYGTLVLMLIVVPALPAFHSDAIDSVRRQQAWLWLYGINFLQAREADWLPYVSHFWSLAVEEHFYLVWPLAVWFLTPRRLLALCAGLVVFSTIARVLLAWGGVNDIAVHVLTFTRLDGLGIGAFLAVYAREYAEPHVPLRRAGCWLAVAGAVGVTALVALGTMTGVPVPAVLTARRTFFVLLLAALIPLGLTGGTRAPLGAVLSGRVLRFFGTYSYGLYVFHAIIADYMRRHDTLAALTRFVPNVVAAVLLQAAIGTLLSVTIAVASYEWYERRFLALKERFRSQTVRATTAADPAR
jgi:peptidoglycan/LPS O-acetylase OafA/YrhL